MSLNIKIKVAISLILVIILMATPIITTKFSIISSNTDHSDYNDDIISDKDNLKISKISVPIYINNNDTNYNWSVSKAAGICNGSGTYSDPYIIEDLVINGGDSGSGIWIENSNVYFRIENCTVYNTGFNPFDAGIRLLAVSNGHILNNNCSNNNIRGIYLENTNNITISGNLMNDSGLYISGSLEEVSSHQVDTTNLVNGKPLYYYSNQTSLGPSNFSNAGQVILTNCHDSNISNLNVSYASNGILLLYCFNNTISGNTANNNTGRGIFLYKSHNATISGNMADYNDQGIYLEDSFNSTISDNTVNSNNRGIYLYKSSDSIIEGNTANNNYDRGISLSICNDSIIDGNTANNNYDRGISLSICNDSIIDGNTVSYNDNHDIRLSACNNITISGNIMNECGLYIYGSYEEVRTYDVDTTNLVNGKPLYYYSNENNLRSSDFSNAGQVILANCNNSIISNLNLAQTIGSILLLYCNNNTISEITTSNNIKHGIALYSSNNNTISGSTVNNNGDEGIYLESSNNNTISNNNIYLNTYQGIFLVYSNYNSIMKNFASFNSERGIILYYSNNNIVSENTVNDNGLQGMVLISSNFNNISSNTVSNNYIGIYLGWDTCSNNTIFLNCFIDNGQNAQDDGLNNKWDNGIKGNYWSHYEGYDFNKDGISDDALNIDGSAGSQDNYPLMKCPISTPPRDTGDFDLVLFLVYIISVVSFVSIALIVAFRRKRKANQ